MGTTTLLALEQLLSEAISDDLEFEADSLSTGTTAIVLASTLANHDWGSSDYFNRYWLYVTETANNAGVLRQVEDYLTASSSAPELKLRGAAFATSTGTASVTCRLHKFNRNNKIRALKRSIDQIYPHLYIPIDDQTLITGNILPNAHFEDNGSSTTTPTWYTASNVTPTLETSIIRGGLQAVKLTATAANGYLYIDSDTYPRLLDLMGRDVNFYCWAYPETADDAYIVVYTLQADGTAQTLTSTTANPAAAQTLLKLENQSLNDDLVKVEIRFKVATNNDYVIFDDAMIQGKSLFEYLLPEQFQVDAVVNQVRFQESGYSDEIVYDIKPRDWTAKEEFKIFTEDIKGTQYKFMRFLNYPTRQRRIRIEGIKKLETPTTDAGTISLDGTKLNLLVAYAAHLLYEMEKGTVSVDDRDGYERESRYWLGKYNMLLPQLMMMRPSGTLRTGVR